MLPLYHCDTKSSRLRNLRAKLLNLLMSVSNKPFYFSEGYMIYAKYKGSVNLANQTHKHNMYKCTRSFLWWHCMIPLWELVLLTKHEKESR